MGKFLFIGIIVLLPVAYCAAMDHNDSTSVAEATLTIRSGIAGVKVFADSVYLGPTPLDSVRVSAGTHVFRFIHPEERSWLYPAIIETITLAPSGHLNRTIDFPAMYHITSEPYGATVRSGDSLLGQTPIFLPSTSIKNLLTITKDGYETQSVPMSIDRPEVRVALKSLHGPGFEKRGEYLSTEQSKSSLGIYLTTGATVVTGVAAAYFKIRADSYYSDYQQTNDPALLSKVRTNDTISGISLAASEFSLLMLTYLLLSR
jgi:hypothetical protein